MDKNLDVSYKVPPAVFFRGIDMEFNRSEELVPSISKKDYYTYKFI
jgi:hypothetical protein